MLPNPLHPALVHIPLGLVFIMPLFVLTIFISMKKNWLPPWSWLLVFLAHILLFGSALLAREAGENEHDKVAKIMNHDLIEEHEEAAEDFIICSGALLGISLLGMWFSAPFAKREKLEKMAQILIVGGSLLNAAIAAKAGHLGGELVYKHDAAKAYLTDVPTSQPDPGPEKDDD